ncbi:TetR/AcrR family transcriptional regulator [Limosilactobacillus kribbianus]|uniref:TetR/AcrR family transcriptional regulator n=1 Tax=Limosilactobacillus kribbianus TaxID=2982695 RepID=UPI0022644954|nr:TetR/AcrR family transcriptional regulator [Limosilactobacillus kribbianus]
MTKLNRQLIIQTGKELIRTDQQPTFSTIGRRLGVHSQALYPYFQNQAALKAAIVNDLLAQLISFCQKQAKNPGLHAQLLVIRSQALSHPRLARFVLNQLQNAPAMVTQDKLKELRDLLHDLLVKTYRHPRVRLLASRTLRSLVIGNIYNNINGWFTDQQLTTDESFTAELAGTLQWLKQLDGKE